MTILTQKTVAPLAICLSGSPVSYGNGGTRSSFHSLLLLPFIFILKLCVPFSPTSFIFNKSSSFHFYPYPFCQIPPFILCQTFKKIKISSAHSSWGGDWSRKSRRECSIVSEKKAFCLQFAVVFKCCWYQEPVQRMWHCHRYWGTHKNKINVLSWNFFYYLY